jgi:DNA-binding NarL/FixJ family response regulator
MTIFIVEDSLAIRDRLRASIAELGGYEVSGEADNETEAVQRIIETNPDIVILDLALAEGSGIEVLRKIRAVMPAIRVIVLSNHATRPYREKCRLLGADYFLSKSKDFDLLPKLLPQMSRG